MHTRKFTVGRNLLRFFEIALFFAVSVLGYGLLFKTVTLQGKSKTRTHTPDAQHPLAGKNADPEQTSPELHPASPSERLFSQTKSDNQFHIHRLLSDAIPHSRGPSFSISGRLRYHGDHARTPLPHNLLQENPVLLI